MRRGAALAAAVLALAASVRAAPAPDARFTELERSLDYGLWNNRINALYDVGELGRDGLPLLSYASDDLDWQVRLTVVHFLGKLGDPAAGELARIARAEECPTVRISAYRWLSGMGPRGLALRDAQMSAEDARELASEPDRYGTERMGKPLVIDAPGGSMTPEFFHGGPDFRACASSERSGRRHRGPGEPDAREAFASRAQDDQSEVVTPPVPEKGTGATAAPARGGAETLPGVPPLPARAGAAAGAPAAAAAPRAREPLDSLMYPGAPENLPPGPPAPERAPDSPASPPLAFAAEPRAGEALDALLASGRPETLPPGPPAPARAEPAPAAAARFESPADRAAPARTVAASAPPRAAETLPGVPPTPPREASAPGTAELVADAGAGKPEADPVPELISRLERGEARRRARAADELGKRGAAAAPALPALRRALGDRDRRVRASAALALGNIGAGAADVAADLRRCLRDKDEDVRFSAAVALERLERPR